MLGGSRAATASRGSKNDREWGLSTKHVVNLGHLIHDLIHRREGEYHHTRTDDGAEAATGGANTRTHIGFFRNEANSHPISAKLGYQLFQGAETAAQMEHLVISPHLLTKRLQQRVCIVEFSHDSSSVDAVFIPAAASHRAGACIYGAKISNNASSGWGKGLALAKSIASSTAC